jgi:hypothetical protein
MLFVYAPYCSFFSMFAFICICIFFLQMQQMLSDPAALQSMMQSPMVQQMMASNPQMAQQMQMVKDVAFGLVAPAHTHTSHPKSPIVFVALVYLKVSGGPFCFHTRTLSVAVSTHRPFSPPHPLYLSLFLQLTQNPQMLQQAMQAMNDPSVRGIAKIKR